MRFERRSGRRKFLGVAAGVVAAGAVGAALPRAARSALASTRDRSKASAGSGAAAAADGVGTAQGALPAFFRDLPGTNIDRWKVVNVVGMHLGAVAVVLETATGDRYQVDVLRRDASGPAGVGNTPSLSVFVVNRGDGALATAEEHGLGAMALATVLAEREARGASAPALLTFAERVAQHPGGNYAVPV